MFMLAGNLKIRCVVISSKLNRFLHEKHLLEYVYANLINYFFYEIHAYIFLFLLKVITNKEK